VRVADSQLGRGMMHKPTIMGKGRRKGWKRRVPGTNISNPML
jgi:hypothetical protein